jgi:hypothetical protein
MQPVNRADAATSAESPFRERVTEESPLAVLSGQDFFKKSCPGYRNPSNNKPTLPVGLLLEMPPPGTRENQRQGFRKLRSSVAAFVRRFLLVCTTLSCFFLLPLPAFPEWQQPTSDELKMTADPAAPDSPAVYLFLEEKVDDNLHYHSFYARIKILTEKGKEMFGDIALPYEAQVFNITDISGRTIHSDGTVIPFSGKPLEKLVMHSGDRRVMEKVFSMPDVQVGSIIEYRWQLRYDNNTLSSPNWYIQQPVFVHKAHYHFNATKSSHVITSKEHGHENVANGLSFSYSLPAGVKVREGLDGFDLSVENIPALPDEDYMPPFQSFSYRVTFYYSPWLSVEDYWKNQGKYWTKEVDRFADVSARIKTDAQAIVAPGDSDQQKAQKIYEAVMQLENTSFTRTHSALENKAEGLKVKTAADIWDQKRGSDDEIARLYLALARAVGLKAYQMIVVNRDQNVMQQAYLNWDQMDDEIVIVSIGGKEVYLDPGQRYCEFGKLHWKHTWTNGVRQTDNGTAIAMTPGMEYAANREDRYANLKLDADGTVHGQIRIAMTGVQALRWRQQALRGDEAEVKKAFEDSLQPQMPPGVQAKTNHFISLNDSKTMLMAIVDVSGSIGTATGKRVFLPAIFFEASSKPLFVASKRENVVDLHYPRMIQDQVMIDLPENLGVESLPQKSEVKFLPFATYASAFGVKGSQFQYARSFVLGTPFYKPDEYSQLRDFYQKLNTADQEQLVLKVGSAPAAVPATTGSNR